MGFAEGETTRVRFAPRRARFAALRGERAAASGTRHESAQLLPGAEAYRLGAEESATVRSGRQSLLRAELVRVSQIERNRGYKERVHDPLWPLCQSLPEVVLRAPKIAATLAKALSEPPLFAAAFSLASVLARDAGDALRGAPLDALVTALTDALRTRENSAELGKAAFASLSYVFRYCAAPLLADDQGWPAVRTHYPALLGAHAHAEPLCLLAISFVPRRNAQILPIQTRASFFSSESRRLAGRARTRACWARACWRRCCGGSRRSPSRGT